MTWFAGPERTPIKLRGLHIDIARHFIHADTIVRIIARMAELRLNTLHLHLSDDQGFPVEFERYPVTHSGPRLSIADQERIARECRARGIQIIPEIDIPGHARALLSWFDDAVRPERRLGIITTEYIDLERDVPVVLDMFDELVERFGARMIHMGGDEASEFRQFPELIARVCAWAQARELSVIAWDDVLDAIDEIPDNLIIQRWRRAEVFRRMPRDRVILSRGYYLDRLDDPFCYYRRSPDGDNFGCIACMWTELVTDETIECTIFPSLYLIAHRWWTYPDQSDNPARLLRALCDAYGYPDSAYDDWRTRRWVGFYQQDPRSTSSVTVDDVLRREHDLYPAFSRALVIATDALTGWLQHDQPITDDDASVIRALGTQACGDDLSWLIDKRPGWRDRVSDLRDRERGSLLYHDGMAIALAVASAAGRRSDARR